MSNERIEWTGRQSQWQNLWWFVSCVFIVPIPLAAWRWLDTRSNIYELSGERLKTMHGVFTRVTDDLELYRVRDTRLHQTFWQRICGRANVVLYTTDASTPEVHLRWLAEPEQLRETIRRLVEARREIKRVRTFETGEEGFPG